MITESSRRHSKCRGKVPLILNLGTRWRQVVNFTLWLLYPQERTLVPTEQENGQAPKPDHPACSMCAIPTPLSWLPGRHSMSEKP